MNYGNGRPVVVNSLLCFLKNYREQANILQIVDQYFTLESRRLSYQILLELLSENDKLAVASSICTPSLLDLFDRVSRADSPNPIFATDDLTVLPLSLNYDDSVEQPKDLYNEVRQLRLYVHNALGQKTYNSPQWKRNAGIFDPTLFNPNFPNFSHIRPKTPTKVPKPTDFNVTSLLKNDNQMSNLQCSPNSSSSSTSSEILPERVIRTRKPLNRLDKAVQKLTDRLLKTEEANNNEEDYGNESFETNLNTELIRESNNNTIAAFGSSAAAITAQIIQKLSTNYENNSPMSQNAEDDQSNELINEEQMEQEDAEFGQENEKSSSHGSPTPSDISLSRNCMDPTTDPEKPYVCSLSNCRKRFTNKFLLKKHMFIHTGLRPHGCPYCSKQFNRKDNLLRHRKTHLNNAIAQANGRRRHNALCGVSEETAANLHLFHQVNNLIEESSPVIRDFLQANHDETNQFTNESSSIGENKKRRKKIDSGLTEES